MCIRDRSKATGKCLDIFGEEVRACVCVCVCMYVCDVFTIALSATVNIWRVCVCAFLLLLLLFLLLVSVLQAPALTCTRVWVQGTRTNCLPSMSQQGACTVPLTACVWAYATEHVCVNKYKQFAFFYNSVLARSSPNTSCWIARSSDTLLLNACVS